MPNHSSGSFRVSGGIDHLWNLPTVGFELQLSRWSLHDEIYGASEHTLKIAAQCKILRQPRSQVFPSVKGNDEIHIAGSRIEADVIHGGAKNGQLRHPMPTARQPDVVQMLFYQWDHDYFIPRSGGA
jgi:hypothetical protein